MRTLPVVPLLALALSLLPSGSPLTAPLMAGFEDVPQLAHEQAAGTLVMDRTTRQAAVGGMPVDFKRSPDATGPDGKGRYLIAVNSGYGIQFSAATNGGQQSLAVIDLGAEPAPVVIQNVYFPSPQSANVGVAFGPGPGSDGTFPMYVSGGVENKVWVFRFRPGVSRPITPPSAGPATTITAPFIDVSGLTDRAPLAGFNSGLAPVYPAGLAISPDGQTLFTANRDSPGARRLLTSAHQVDLRREGGSQLIYPYAVVVAPPPAGSEVSKVYVSCWNDATVAVIDPRGAGEILARIPVERHPTAMILNDAATRLFVANSNADSVSVIDTDADREIERLDVRLTEHALIGGSPEGLALGPDGRSRRESAPTRAVVGLSAATSGQSQPLGGLQAEDGEEGAQSPERSLVKGFIPAGRYPSAVAVAGNTLFVGNGKGTGVEPSSLVVTQSGRSPKLANDRFPAGDGSGGQYIGSLIVGNIGAVPVPDAGILTLYTQQVLRRNRMVGERRTKLFAGANPIRHVIYIIKENRTYDQVFGDITRSGDGSAADGDPSLAIFGIGDGASRPGGAPQRITPNQHALALRFGLLDRFFVNSEASPDGHNWSTAAFSSDYVDKAFRWSYSGRGRTYDYEGFNRLPGYEPPSGCHRCSGCRSRRPIFRPCAGSSARTEPVTCRSLRRCICDLAARRDLSYRSYGSSSPPCRRPTSMPSTGARRKAIGLSATSGAIPTKKTLEGHHSLTVERSTRTPDALTAESHAAKERRQVRSVRGRIIRRAVRLLAARRLARRVPGLRERSTWPPDRLPQLSIMKLPCNHTSGLSRGLPTPQFMVAENDYAVGRLIEALSTSPYWKDTAVLILEDDAQDGPDHVDAHRSPALVVSAYNRPGTLVHDFHNTVSLIRTMELLLGLPPMNLLDAAAAPIDVFRDTPA
jgi:DNA-binding beta-propeller fold protein YncE